MLKLKNLIRVLTVYRLKSFGWGNQFFVFFVSVLKKLALEGFFCTFCLLFACTIPHFSECMGDTTPPAAPPVDDWAEGELVFKEMNALFEKEREVKAARFHSEKDLREKARSCAEIPVYVSCSESSSTAGGGGDVPRDPLGIVVLVLLGLLLVGVCYVTWGCCMETFPEGEVVEDPQTNLPEALGKKGGSL